MIILSGNSLSKRQHELNSKVNEAAASNISFEDVKSETEQTDVDTFFKIDLASKYKNIDYIIEILKSGDSLHITRALKSIWLYDDEYSNIINPDYLNTNIFPMMSSKLKRKLLTVISTHVKKEERANDFYTYCIAEKLPEIAYKFLINVSESTKLQFLQDKNNDFDNMLSDKNDKYLLHFIGSSFILADAYLKTVHENCRNRALYGIRHLYSVSDIKFLDLIDKYALTYSSYYMKYQLGSRVSKNIMEKHKERVLRNPPIYLEMLNKSMLVKHSNSENAKQYLVALLPRECSSFWDDSFCKKYKFLLDLIPLEERFQYVKKIFTHSYPDQEFEMTLKFYELEYYDLMTVNDKEVWALKHIQNQKEILGTQNDYIWYKFVNFQKALPEIKKYIMITPGKDKRSDMLNILIESAKTQSNLVILFNHYYQRHVNEERHYKQIFLKKVTVSYNILDFDEDCWSAYNILLQSIDLYSDSYNGNFDDDLTVLVLFYHILHKKDVPEVLNRILDNQYNYYTLKQYLKTLNDEKKEMVYQYILQYYLKAFNQFNDETYNEEVQKKVRTHIDLALELFKMCDKTKKDCPEIVKKYADLDWDKYRFEAFFNDHKIVQTEITQEHCIRHLKKDAALAIEDLPLIKNTIENTFKFNLNKLLRKLKIYFPNDVAKNYLDFFINLLSDTKPYVMHTKIKSSVHAIFQLADDNFKSNFMMKHVPTDPKIDHSNKDEQLLYTQEYICRFACYSRPPVPLSNMLMYIKGDYVRSCLPMFNMYLANLPLPQCLEFIAAILDAPLSIQKHGIRMAFGCFNTENLNNLILRVWKKTKNVSLRLIIYKALYNKLLNEKETAQKQLFETLKLLTYDLHQDDDDQIFDLLTSNKLPQCFVSDFLEAVWKAVGKFPNKSKNLVRMSRIINDMGNHINMMQKATIKPIIDDHIKTMLIDEQIRDSYDKSELTDLNKAKWELVANYLMNIKNEGDLEENLVLLKTITNRCFDMWNVKHSHLYTVRHFYPTFISDLQSQSLRQDRMDSDDYSIIIFRTLLKDLEESLPIHKIYLHIWDLRLTIINRDVLKTGRYKHTEENKEENKLPIIKGCVLNFSRQLGNLIKEFVHKELYFKSLFTSIKREVEEKLETLYDSMFDFRTDDLDLTDVYVIAANGLLEFEMPETYLLALNILPLNYNRGYHDEDYVPAVKKIRASENTEIQCNMYERFVNTDFAYRDFMES